MTVAAASIDQAAVLARYDELAALLSGMDDRPRSDADLAAAATPVLLHEARLLDAGRFEDWLCGWTDDAVLVGAAVGSRLTPAPTNRCCWTTGGGWPSASSGTKIPPPGASSLRHAPPASSAASRLGPQPEVW